jgi:hypothetical protein
LKIRQHKNMKHFASFIASPSQADNNSFLNRLRVPLAGLGGQTAGGVVGKAGGGLLAHKLAEGKQFESEEDKEDYIDNISSGIGTIGSTLGGLAGIHVADKNFLPDRFKQAKEGLNFIRTGRGTGVYNTPIMRNSTINSAVRVIGGGAIAGSLLGIAKGSGLWESQEEKDRTRPFYLSRDKALEKATDPQTGEVSENFEYTPSRQEKISDNSALGSSLGAGAAGLAGLGLLATRPWTRSMYYKYNRRNYKPMANQQKAITPNVPQLNPTIPNWRMK